MLKNFVLKGILHGVTGGLIVTFFDTFFMLYPNIYIPLSYPVLLITFNILLWTLFGLISGILLWFFCKKKRTFLKREGFYWSLFFLLPFAMVYGCLGRFHISVLGPFTIRLTGGFDHFLSFIWVMIIIALVSFNLKKSPSTGGHSLLFIPEIITFILFFQFCSNISKFEVFSSFYSNHQRFLQSMLGLNLRHFLIVLYIGGIFLIFFFYFVLVFKFLSFTTKRESKINSITVFALSLIIPCFVLSVFSFKHYTHINKHLPNIHSQKGNQTKAVPYIILIVLDTVRADQLSMYNKTLSTSINLNNFASEALVFKNCFATSPWTIPSHASIFTGFYSKEHGTHGNLESGDLTIFGIPIPEPLSKKFVTLAEVFRDSGYKTAAVVANFSATDPELNLNQGFQICDNSMNIGIVYQNLPFRPILHPFCYITNIYPKFVLYYRSAEDINKSVFQVIDKLIPSPFFLFINFLDAHEPYRPPRPYDGYFLHKSFPQLHRLIFDVRRFLKRFSIESFNKYLLSQYDGEIAYLDDQLGKLFDYLKQLGIYDSALIIVTADHGELLGEHGLYGHLVPMYEGVIRIPLLIKFPHSTRTGCEEAPITLADIYPTILSICGLPISKGISGRAFGKSTSPVVAEFYNYGIGKHRIIYNDKYKYMQYEHQKMPELYDIKKDPYEQKNLLEKLPDVTIMMQKKLKHWEKNHIQKYSINHTEKTSYKGVKDKLKALGYIQ